MSKSELKRRAIQSAPRWRSDSKFEGAWIPRFDDQPEGPKMQSMVMCKCGAWWKDHEFAHGWCPAKS
jgi:hypothetical protein